MNNALLLIDIQRGLEPSEFWGGERNNPDMEINAVRLLSAWRKVKAPVVHIQHASQSPGSPLRPECEGFAFKDGFFPAPGEKHIIKHQNSAFIGTDLECWLRDNNITDVTIAGITIEHCVSTTVRMAENLGFSVKLIFDACHAYAKKSVSDNSIISADIVYETELSILSGEFAEIISTDTAIQRLN